jgi:hypothetical protein
MTGIGDRMSDEKWTKMDIGPNMISFGTQRIPVRNVSSISVNKGETRAKEISALFTLLF